MDIIYSLLKQKSEFLSFLNKNNLFLEMFNTEQALERESLRVNKKTGLVSTKNHPEFFEPKELHPFIKTDYSEAQVEFISPVFKDSKSLYNFMNLAYDIFNCEMEEDEVLFPYSMPPTLTNIEDIAIAKFDDTEYGAINKKYRTYLTSKYGKDKQLISGIHYNFSLSEKFLEKFYEKSKVKIDYPRFKTEIYFKIMRNYNRYKFIVTYLQGASPFGYDSKGNFIEGVSLRNSNYGYKNIEDINLDYDNVDKFLDSIVKAVADKKIFDGREIYSAIRLKGSEKLPLRAIVEKGVKYVEIRNIDLNPFEKSGISESELEFLNLFLIFCLVFDDCTCATMSKEADNNLELVAMSQDKSQKLTFCNGNIALGDYVEYILDEMVSIFKNSYVDVSSIYKYKEDIKNNKLQVAKVAEVLDGKNFEKVLVDLGNTYKTTSLNTQYKYFGYEDMELSTQILMREAIKNGIYVDILDNNDNFISLKQGDKKEYVKQCTKTSKDSYISMLLMENKIVTKKVLEEKNIPTPKGDSFTNKEKAIAYALSLGEKFVIKPNSTNFGIGVFIFLEKATYEDILEAVEYGFSQDKRVIVEEYIQGTEYRFLIIGDEVAGVLERVPANVIGNGTSSIKKLVEIKNMDPLRSKGYRTPLELISIDENVKLFLKQKGLDENYIPKNNEQIFLRQNSNISTGGDSIDHTDFVIQKYKDIAVNASKAVEATFNGVDMIIEDYTKENSEYGIIELNFNPAIHIHSFPYKGTNRKIAKKVLIALGFEVK
ncbi:MAG: bifunctional glutamate--cysteine ligase GshA/glutathione synthetase GshB [Lachnospirales bacterium]